MSMTDIETRLTERLAQLANYAPDEPTADFSAVVPLARVREMPKRRVPTWAMAAGVAVIVGGSALALATLTTDSDHRQEVVGRSVVPSPVHHLTITASNFQYQAKNFDVPAGITEITFVTTEGSHTLVFAEPELSYVHLAAPEGRNTVKVDLVEGRVYTIFDTIVGHRALGMEATITVGPPVDQAK